MFQNKKPNWNETDSTSDAYIQNKPTIPAAQVQADWEESDSSDVSFILNKPTIVDNTNYLCFTSGQANSTVNFKKVGNPDAIAIEYSTNNKESWNDYTWATNDGLTITLNVGESVYFRAKNTNAHVSKGWDNYHYFACSGMLFGSGSIMSLLDKTCKLNEVTDNFCFVRLFSGFNDSSNTKLYSAPELPAKKLVGIYCYAFMFADCKLTEMPELPAVELSEACYSNLFDTCSSLSVVKNLPIASLAKSCFDSMFNRCNSLKRTPELPAMTLAENCYARMFSNCANLEYASDLPAETLAKGCYSTMFLNCKKLEKAPVIYAKYFAQAAFKDMFQSCENLINANTFKNAINITYQEILWETFYYCKKLKYTPKVTGTTPAWGAFVRTFDGCQSLSFVMTTQTSWDNTEWLNGVPATGVLNCPSTLDTSTRDISHVPAGWTVTHGANEPDDGTTSEVEATTTDIYTVCPSSKETGVLTVTSALTLNAMPNANTEIAYAEVVLDIASATTVTAGSNITFVDTLTAGKRNVCVVRWSGGTARLYVTIVEDLDESASN